jgi:hypothetical protein
MSHPKLWDPAHGFEPFLKYHDPDGIVVGLGLTGLDNAFEKTSEFLDSVWFPTTNKLKDGRWLLMLGTCTVA